MGLDRNIVGGKSQGIGFQPDIEGLLVATLLNGDIFKEEWQVPVMVFKGTGT